MQINQICTRFIGFFFKKKLTTIWLLRKVRNVTIFEDLYFLLISSQGKTQRNQICTRFLDFFLTKKIKFIAHFFYSLFHVLSNQRKNYSNIPKRFKSNHFQPFIIWMLRKSRKWYGEKIKQNKVWALWFLLSLFQKIRKTQIN